MTRRQRVLRLAVIGLLLSACKHRPIHGPAPQSAQPEPSNSVSAGVARVDITPPPGPGLMGYGTEGARSRGYRLRLYARSLVLRDAAGEKIALVVVDLGMVSGLLQRTVAERIAPLTGIGADRLIISATHTHSGPGHFFGTPAYDEQGTSVEGFDSLLVSKLADGIARSVVSANQALMPARLAWGSVPIWGQTRLRNDVAVRRNLPRFQSPHAPPAGLVEPRYRYIDPELHMLRVDRVAGGALEPLGSYMLFPVHGTVIPGTNDLFDGDVQGMVMQMLERAQTSSVQDVNPAVVHLFANGAEGDVVADFSDDTRCPAPAPRVAYEIEGPRRNTPLQRMTPGNKPPQPACLHKARDEAVTIGRAIADSAGALYQRLATEGGVQNVVIRRAYTTVLVERDDADGLCIPRSGPSAMAGGEGGFSRILHLPGLRWFGGIDTIPLPETTAPKAGRCQGVKPSLGQLEAVIAGTHPYVEEFQLTAVQIGDRFLATVPGEPTTNAAALIRRTMAGSGVDAAHAYRHNLVIGLANGYFHYLTTPAEYSAQLYEGAATVYGPRANRVLAEMAGMLVQQIRNSPGASPPVVVRPLLAGHRGSDPIWPRPTAHRHDALTRAADVRVARDTVIAQWRDRLPGDIPLTGNLLIELRKVEADGSSTRVLWDDDPRVLVRLLSEKRGHAEWQARFAPVRAGRYRIVLRARDDAAADSSRSFDVR